MQLARFVPLSFLTGPAEATSLTMSLPVVMVGNEEHKGEKKVAKSLEGCN